MDFLKTLLAYMALLTTLSVQEGPLPQTVPTPTPLPVSVTATVVPFQTEVPTATPAPSAPPVPTITPNTRYTTLRFNDRGNDVRKLQSRLIELGYMPAGSADGAYGYQTYNAVKDFQRANGLSVDGTAGPATLTNLYENPNVQPKATATLAPTATPTPSLPPLPTPGSYTAVPATETPAPVYEDIMLPEYTPAPTASATSAAEAFVLTEVPDALVISGNTGMALTILQTVDGTVVPLRPALWVDSRGNAVMSLRDLVDCYTGWTLAGSSADGLYTLQAAGYTIVMQFAGDDVLVTVDGQATDIGSDEVQLQNGQIYVKGAFLEKAIGATVIFDAEERSLVLFIRDRSAAIAND